MRRIIGFVAGAMIALCAAAPAFAQSSPKKYLSAAGTNSTLVMAASPAIGTGVNAGVLLKTLVGSNSTATAYFLKLYNKASAPTCGTDTPVQTIELPAGQTVPIDYGLGSIYPLGLGFCLTGAIADNDTTAAAAGVAINLGISGR